MLWIAPLIVALAGTSLLAYLAAQVRREILPTEKVIDEFGRTLRLALVRTRDETARTRARRPQR